MRTKKIATIVVTAVLALLCVLPIPAYAKAKSPTLAIDSNTVGMTRQEKKIYKKLKAQMRNRAFREGRRWTNDNGYTAYFAVNGVPYIVSGCGCHGYALKLSDKVFGKRTPVKMHHKYKKLRVGDLVRVDDDKWCCHTFVIMKVAGSKAVITEGNYGGRIHWGRVVKLSWIKKHGSYVYTRY